MSTKSKFSTRCVHEGEIKDTMYQGIVSPLFMSTTYPWYGGDAEKKPYPRYFNTPNQEFLSKKIASLENGEKALIFTSGMAAISTSIMANVKSGDHIVVQNDIYGGTRNFVQTDALLWSLCFCCCCAGFYHCFYNGLNMCSSS